MEGGGYESPQALQRHDGEKRKTGDILDASVRRTRNGEIERLGSDSRISKLKSTRQEQERRIMGVRSSIRYCLHDIQIHKLFFCG